jgi:uncharacterized membrane protein YukC
MPIPIEKIQVIEDEIERQHGAEVTSDDDENEMRHTTAMTPPDQDFSFLKNSAHTKRSVHYNIEQLDDHEQRPLRTVHENENVLRRRYIAHWGLPGSLTFILFQSLI